MESAISKTTRNIGRDSNFELYRIILMLAIIAHHYVVNSGFSDLYDFNHITGNMIFLQLLGFAGKIGINCFVFVTGYFMIKSQFRFEKLLKLYLEIKFYKFVIYIILLVAGYESLSIGSLLKTVFNVAYGVEAGFTGTFIFLYMLVPFLNTLLLNISSKLHLILIGILLLLYTFIPTFLMHETYSNLGWLITVYIIAAYVRLNPNSCFEKKSIYIWGFLCSVALSWASILVVDFVGTRFGFSSYYFMVVNENKFLAVTTSFCFFMIFKNIKMKQNRFINGIAASTFGVFLIHTNSEAMRTFLWEDLLKNTDFYASPFLIVHAVCSIAFVYIICVCIDQLRLRFLEKPLFQRIGSRKK